MPMDCAEDEALQESTASSPSPSHDSPCTDEFEVENASADSSPGDSPSAESANNGLSELHNLTHYSDSIHSLSCIQADTVRMLQECNTRLKESSDANEHEWLSIKKELDQGVASARELQSTMMDVFTRVRKLRARVKARFPEASAVFEETQERQSPGEEHAHDLDP